MPAYGADIWNKANMLRSSGKVGAPLEVPTAQDAGGPPPSFFQQVRQDPMMQMAMMQAGAQMLQPAQPGQTPLGQVGAGIQTGFGSLAKQRKDAAALQAEAQKENRKMSLEERKEDNVRLGLDRESRMKQAEFRQRLREWDTMDPVRSAELEKIRAQARAYDRDNTGETERLTERLGRLLYGQGGYDSPEQAELDAINFYATAKNAPTEQQFSADFFKSVGAILPFMPDMSGELVEIHNQLLEQMRKDGTFDNAVSAGPGARRRGAGGDGGAGVGTQPPPQEGDRAHNKQTGEWLIFENGAWVPLNTGTVKR